MLVKSSLFGKVADSLGDWKKCIGVSIYMGGLWALYWMFVFTEIISSQNITDFNSWQAIIDLKIDLMSANDRDKHVSGH